MNDFEKQYCDVLSYCLKKGYKVIGRNGKTRQITGAQIRANIKNGFPIVTGKQIFPTSCFIETEWMLKGFTNVKWLNEKGVKIWDQWANSDGDLGPVYGHQLLNFNGINQLNNIIEEAKKNKYSRRLLCSMWNPCDLSKMSLPPCHYSFQFVISNNKADIVVCMRSLDLFIGLPYDIVMYSTILVAFCKELNLEANEVIINAANAHVYEEHISSTAIYCGRQKHKLPTLLKTSTITNFSYLDMQIENYNYEQRLKVNVIK
jgi:thymidylate synthase